MTRSILSARGPEAAKKTFRAQAKAQGLTFRAAAELRNSLPKQKDPIAPGMGRRTHGNGGVGFGDSYWDGRARVWVGGLAYDDEDNEDPTAGLYSDSEMEVHSQEGHWTQTRVVVSLLDIAKPKRTKAKGVARDFEMIDSVPRVLTLGDEWADLDEKDEDIDWAEWDQAYGEWKGKEKASYSDIVEGKTVRNG
ncbi:hypothetical protein H0H81_001487 [Sphagnurus paluster]|uniref:Uncharacterized protein n=1 Tax=Sphagnurus paluster TaxID=117069 RepID=A0A9P7FPI0_9AGAR|nr:hypothetical protein H0H81_001487 [Sphagnurus paluster]